MQEEKRQKREGRQKHKEKWKGKREREEKEEHIIKNLKKKEGRKTKGKTNPSSILRQTLNVIFIVGVFIRA